MSEFIYTLVSFLGNTHLDLKIYSCFIVFNNTQIFISELHPDPSHTHVCPPLSLVTCVTAAVFSVNELFN